MTAQIESGARLGPYEIVSRIGAGGMGEVWRARDARIGREIAIKVLPESFAADADRLQRFEQEARAAGTLNHPNLVTIFELGTHEGAPFIAMELLDGETLRERLDRGPVPPRKAIEYAVQMANGLAAAHEKGVVHRDLKPENIFVTLDGRLKILDFGLAKLTQPDVVPDDATVARPRHRDTAPGTVMGTAGYMSPEQVRGQYVDHRTDIFAFGAILYEVLSGRRAFHRDTAADTMSAILNEDPPDLASSAQHISPAVDRVVRRCLEKQPAERFQSARDLGFALEAVTASGINSVVDVPDKPRPRYRLAVIVAAVLLALAAGAAIDRMIASRRKPKAQSFRQMTFAKGIVYNARFSPDGKTIVYDGSFDGAPSSLFTTRDDSPGARPLLDAPRLLSVSSKGELAILVKAHFLYHFQFRGTLARVALGGGTPREVIENVREADWSPDGSELAIIRDAGGLCRLEFPAGRVLFSTQGYLANPRVSPDGKMVAFFNHPLDGDDRGSLEVVDLAGHRTTLFETGGAEEGLAWRPDSKEIWFTAATEGANTQLRASSIRGELRTIIGTPGGVIVQDIAPDGRVLLCRDSIRSYLLVHRPGDAGERDVSWLDQGLVSGLSPDGKILAFTEQSEAAGPTYAACIRDLSGGAPVRLGNGNSGGLSPDGRYILTQDPDTGALSALPTGAGEAHRLPTPARFRSRGSSVRWLPNGSGVVLFGVEDDRSAGYVIDFPNAAAHPIAGAATVVNASDIAVTLDSRAVAVGDRTSGRLFVVPLDGSKPWPVAGARPFERPLAWADAKTLYVRIGRDVPAAIDLLDVTTGQRRPWKSLGPADRSGQPTIYGLAMTSDGSTYAYDVLQELTDLFLVDGLS
jgi:serine/threonine protein kinase/Tol biopolymer transport system component